MLFYLYFVGIFLVSLYINNRVAPLYVDKIKRRYLLLILLLSTIFFIFATGLMKIDQTIALYALTAYYTFFMTFYFEISRIKVTRQEDNLTKHYNKNFKNKK